MNTYFISVFAVCSCLGILGLLSYDERNRAQRAALGIILIYVVLSPIAELTFSTEDVTVDFDDLIKDYGSSEYSEIGEAALSDGICRALSDKFSFSDGDVSVVIREFNFEEMKGSSVLVVIRGRAAMADTAAVRRFVNEMGVGECEVEIEIGW